MKNISIAGVVIVALFPVLLLMACGDNDRQPIPVVAPSKDTIVNNQPTPAPGDVVLQFYQWYLQSVYLKKSVEVPEVVLSKDSIYQIDATRHVAFLKESGYFSPLFYANEIQMFNRCGEQLKKVNAAEVVASGGLAVDFVEGDACSFLNWMAWTGGQGEALSTVAVKNTVINADTATVTAVIGDADGLKYSYPVVTLVKESGAWKISKIVISSADQQDKS